MLTGTSAVSSYRTYKLFLVLLQCSSPVPRPTCARFTFKIALWCEMLREPGDEATSVYSVLILCMRAG